MASDPRLFFKLHNGFPEHPKTIELSDKAFRQLVEAWCGAKRKITKRVRAELEAGGFMVEGVLVPSEFLEPGPRITARPPIDPNLRRSIYERDGFTCLHCGSDEDLTLDHIHPWSLGGTTTFENLQTLCRRCNSSKGARV